MWNLCISVFLITLLIALGSYGVYILIVVSFAHIKLIGIWLILTVMSATHDADTYAIDITWQQCKCHHVILMPLLSHDPKCNVVFLSYLRNAMMPLMMLLVPHDTNASANNIKWPKSLVTLHFECPDLRNAMVPLIMLSKSHNADTSTLAVVLWDANVDAISIT